MKNISKTSLSLAIGALLASSASFADMDNSYVNQALQWAPANTFMVFGNTQPYSNGQGEIFVERMSHMMESQYSSMGPMLDALLDEMGNDVPEGMEKLFEVYKDIFNVLSDMSADDFKAMAVESDSAFYFDGIIPVLRMEQSSPDYIQALHGALANHLPTPEQITVEGKQLDEYVIEMDDSPFPMVVIVENQNDGFVLSVMPKPMKDYYIKRNFITPVNDSVWGSGKLVQMRDQHGYNGLSEGYIDLRQAFETFLENPADSDDPILQMLAGSAPDLKTMMPGCYDVVVETLDNVPRIVMGVKESAADYDEFNLTIETSAGVADTLKRIPSDIPGTQVAEDAMLSFGLGVDLMALQSGLNTLSDYINRSAVDCPPMADMDMSEALMGMEMMMNPMVTQFSGANVIITDISFDGSGEPDPSSLKGAVAVSVEDSQSIIDMAPMMGINVDVPANGTAVDFPTDMLPPELAGQTVMVGRNGSEIAFGIGSDAKQMVEAILVDDEIRLDQAVKYSYNFSAIMNNPMLKELMLSDLDGFPDSEVSEMKAMIDSMLELYKLYDTGSLSLDMNDNGIGFTVKQSYNL